MRYDQTSEELDDTSGLFEQAPPIERRKWRDPDDEAHDLLTLGQKVYEGRGRVQRYDAWRYAQVLSRQLLRRQLVALRRQVEGWAADAQANGMLHDLDPLDLMRDMVEVLDDRLRDHGGVDPGEAE